MGGAWGVRADSSSIEVLAVLLAAQTAVCRRAASDDATARRCRCPRAPTLPPRGVLCVRVELCDVRVTL